jgi:Radical SAM superfamily/4Fe-4S single cluster domain
MQKLVRRSVSFELTKHCNLRCARCDHSSPWFDEAFASVERFEADLRALCAVMELDELRFAGGEPLLHPDLNQFFRIAREHRFATGITMLSNGVLLHTMQDETWELIDALIVSIYPGVRHRFDADAIRRKAEAHRVLLLIEEEHRFDQMLVNDRIPDHRAVEAIYRGCYSATHCHTVYEGRYYKCSRAHLLDERMALAGRPAIGNQPVDGVALHGDPDLHTTLATYLASERYSARRPTSRPSNAPITPTIAPSSSPTPSSTPIESCATNRSRSGGGATTVISTTACRPSIACANPTPEP